MIFRSPYPDVQIPSLSVTDYVLQNAAQFGAKAALIDGPTGRTLTYAQLAGAIRLVAANLARRGFGKGDVLAIYSPNLPEYAVAFHAVAMVGGVNTTVNPLYTAAELAQQLQDSGAKYLLTIPLFLEKAQEAAAQTGIEEIFVFGEAAGATPFASLLQRDGAPAAAEMPQVEINPAEDVVVLPYSSGTTGFPKGVMLTHRNLVANMVQMEGVTDANLIETDDTVIGILPFYHIYGMVVIMNYTLAKGATVVTMPRFDMEQFLQLIQDYKITRMNLVPPIVLGLAKHPLVDKYDLSSLKYITSGAAPLSAELAGAAAKRLNCIVMQGYGLTETSPVTHVCPDYKAVDNPGTIGPSLPSTEVIVADVATQQPLGINEPGEIWIRGPQVMKGYLNNPQATAACIDADGWFHTGDIGYADADHYFYIVDRVKELIKYKGFQVAPAELEALLLTHPAIVDAAVIPSTDEEAGEVPKAFVVRKGALEGEELMAWVAARVSPHKKIRRLEFVDEIPKSASGKILRRVLVERERTT
ncbi:MAG: 4-coumarate--CoA ligase family protein [Caldilineaceae bacterium]|nr:4-coumarate--CoA ligase family protein [Caldilineaceae bacterium]